MNLPNHVLFPCRSWSSASGIPVKKDPANLKHKQHPTLLTPIVRLTSVALTRIHDLIIQLFVLEKKQNKTKTPKKKTKTQNKTEKKGWAGWHMACAAVTSLLRCLWWGWFRWRTARLDRYNCDAASCVLLNNNRCWIWMTRLLQFFFLFVLSCFVFCPSSSLIPSFLCLKIPQTIYI